MAGDRVDIYNLALAAIGTRSTISAPDENSVEAEQCELWYDTVVDQVLAAASWPAARKWQRLAQLAERDPNVDWTNTAPAPQYGWAFSRPSDLIRPRNLDSWAYFILGLQGTQPAIFTNDSAPILVYTSRLTTISSWDPGMKSSVIYGLAAAIALKLTGKNDRAVMMEQKANDFIIEARTVAANSELQQYEVMPEWLAARGFAGGPQARYVYEPGPLLRNAGVIGAR